MQIGDFSSYMPFAQYAVYALIAIIVFDYMFGWVERKTIAKVQARHGPTFTGKYGLLQNLADVIKLLSKEQIVPDKADKLVFALIPPFMLWLFIFLVMLLPLYGTAASGAFSFGLLAIFVAVSFIPLLVFLGGAASGSKYGAISAERSVLMLLGYEIPLLIAVANVAMVAGTYNIADIVSMQGAMWFAISLPIAFIVFFVAMLAEMERPPFDLREADSELIAGWLVDLGAPKYAIALFIDYTRMLLGSALIVLLFLGGWNGPVLPQVAWLMIKVFAVAFFIILIRATTVRTRLDTLMRFSWLVLLPLSLASLLLTFIFILK